MQQVTDLLAATAETDVLQRPLKMMAGHPQSNDSLVDLSHLPGAGDDSATIDQRGQAAGVIVFLDQQFAGELAGPIERTRGPVRGKSSRIPKSETPDSRELAAQRKRLVSSIHGISLSPAIG